MKLSSFLVTVLCCYCFVGSSSFGLIPKIVKECITDEKCGVDALKSYLADFLNNTSNLCPICEEGIPIMKDLIKSNETKTFRAIATAVCVLLNITQESVCYQAVGLFEVKCCTYK